MPRAFCYYTPDRYADEAKLLRASCREHGITLDEYPIPKAESWQRATQLKAEIVAMHLTRHRGPSWYLDVDSIVLRTLPTLVIGDIAAVMLRDELLSGVVWFSNNDKCRDTVARWQMVNAAYPVTLPDGRAAWDQRTLDIAIRDVGAKLTVLPASLNWIPEISRRFEAYPDAGPVVLATRAALRWGTE
jgi:hypothetical protein